MTTPETITLQPYQVYDLRPIYLNENITITGGEPGIVVANGQVALLGSGSFTLEASAQLRGSGDINLVGKQTLTLAQVGPDYTGDIRLVGTDQLVLTDPGSLGGSPIWQVSALSHTSAIDIENVVGTISSASLMNDLLSVTNTGSTSPIELQFGGGVSSLWVSQAGGTSGEVVISEGKPQPSSGLVSFHVVNNAS